MFITDLPLSPACARFCESAGTRVLYA